MQFQNSEFLPVENYLGFAVRQARALSEAEGELGIWDFSDWQGQIGKGGGMKVATGSDMLGGTLGLVGLFFVIGLLGLTARVSLESSKERKIAYERRKLLFSAAERSFLGILDQVVGQEYRVIGKVRIADIIRPDGALSARARTSALNRIMSKHVDFAVCDQGTLQVVGVIELDDASHEKASRRRRDEFVDAALVSAGVPIVRIPAQRVYSPAELRVRLSVLFDPVG